MEGVDTGPMMAEVLRQGMQVRRVEHRLGAQVDFDGYNPHDCIVCYGDIDFVRQVHRRAPFIPGAWCNFDHMKCSTYYAYLGEHLLNQQYIMLPVGDLLRRWDYLAAHTTGNSWFIRPDSGAKPFTGYVVAPAEKHKIQTLIEAVGPDTLVVVAPEKSIIAEWRFVICNKKVIAGCQYLPEESPHYPTLVLCLAIKIGEQEWQPDLCYTVDIAESGGKMYLLEVNSFSCAGLYDCDMEAIIRCASDVAEEEWEEYCAPTATDS